MKFSFKQTFSYEKLSQLLSPKLAVSGLDISETALRLVDLSGTEIKKGGINLEPGVIVGGAVQNKEKLLSALTQLKQSLGEIKGKAHVIVSIPSFNVYAQAFSLPPVAGTYLQEAAELNLQLISPIDIKTAYYDWERISDPANEAGKTELLGAFVSKAVVDDYVALLEQAGFNVVAIEFPALATARLLKTSAGGIDFSKPQVVLTVTGEGLNFSILRNGRLSFNYFVSWISMQARQISLEVFSNTLVQELKRLLTFYSSHWDGQINDLILITQGMEEEIKKMLKTNFPSMVVQTPVFSDKFGGLAQTWNVVLGCALRGKLSRVEDVFISLMAVGTERSLLEDQIFLFIKVWRNIILAILFFLVGVYAFSDNSLARLSSGLAERINTLSAKGGGREVTDLQQKALNFNRTVDKATVAKSKSNVFSPFFDNLRNFAGNSIEFQRISVNTTNHMVTIIALAANESVAVEFKGKLSDQGGFKNIVLPLSDIKINPDGRVSFILSFKL